MKIQHVKAPYDVYITTDYSIFNHVKGNRAVDNTKKLLICIRTLGYIGAPIVVNEKMEIIDGQNRFEVLKALNLPVEYIIRPGLTIKDCIDLNINAKRWSMKDFLRSHAEQGNVTYQWVLNDVIKNYPEFLMDDILAIVNSKGATCNNGSFTRNKIRDGQLSLTANEMTQVEDTMKWLQRYMPYVKKIVAGGKTYPLLNAIMWCEAHCKTSYIDMDRLFDKIFVKNWSKVHRREKVDEYLIQFDDLYNKGLAKTSPKRICATGDYLNALRGAGINVSVDDDGDITVESCDNTEECEEE